MLLSPLARQMASWLLSALLIPAPSIAAPSTSSKSFPVVDLGYARHAPTFTNVTKTNIPYASYRNIRFAVPPTGQLRFRPPLTPPPISHGIQDGLVPQNSTNCIQTLPSWFHDIPGLNGTTWGTEDCLFLDVIVPEGLDPSESHGVPVLHWIYGGGFIFGAKDNGGNPASLLNTIQDHGEKFIVVASNYRIGPFGWMSSDQEPSLFPNAGLYDAYAALNWTKQYIHLFGGDPDWITAMGQSAGGGIIHHLLAADVQGRSTPFSQAVLSSPGYRPHMNRSKEMTDVYNIFLNGTGCTNVECLRELPEDVMRKANAYMILKQATGPFGGPSIGFGPVIDGDLVTDSPDRILARESSSLFDSSQSQRKVRRVITGGMRSDGIGYPPTSKWKAFVEMFARTPTNNTVEAIRRLYGNITDLAPAVKGTEIPAQSTFDKFYGDIIYECHSYFAAKTWSNTLGGSASCANHSSSPRVQAYRYESSAPPATHGDDMKYYFYSDVVAAADPVVNASVAEQFQDYLKRFILGQDMGDWPEYRARGPLTNSWANITSSGFDFVAGKDEALRAQQCETLVEMLGDRCDGW